MLRGGSRFIRQNVIMKDFGIIKKSITTTQVINKVFILVLFRFRFAKNANNTKIVFSILNR